MVIIRQHLLPIALVLVIAGALFHTLGIDTSADSLWYLAASSNLVTNTGYVDFTGEAIANRGPVFAWALSLAQSQGLTIDEVAHAGYVVMRVLMVLNLLLIYLASSALFSRWTGLVAVVLVAMTFVFHQAHSRIIIDPLVPLFTLLTLWLLACIRPLRAWQAGLAGGALGIGFVAKEVVIVFIAAPFVYSALGAIRGRSWKAVPLFWYVFIFALVIALWVFAAGLIRGDITQLLGWAGPKALAMFGVSQQSPLLVADSGGVGGALSRLYHEHVLALGWVTPFALVAVVINALSLRRGHLMLTAFILCWCPVALYIGHADLRAGQSLVLIIMLLMSLAATVTMGFATLLRDLQWPKTAWVVSVILGVGLCAAHGALQRDTQTLFLGKAVDRTSAIAWPFAAKPATTPPKAVGILPRLTRVHDALSDIVQDDAVIMTDIYHGSGLSLLDRHNNPEDTTLQNTKIRYVNLSDIAIDANTAAVADIRSPLMMLGPTWNPLRHNNLVLISADRLNRTLEQHQVTHIVLAGRHRQLATVFDTQPAFIPVTLPKRVAATVYRVTGPATTEYNSAYQLPLAPALTEQLMQLKSDHPDEFARVVETVKARIDVDLALHLSASP